MNDGEGTETFTAEKADGVVGNDQQIPQYLAVFGSHNNNSNNNNLMG
jgi:hypothetical protein